MKTQNEEIDAWIKWKTRQNQLNFNMPLETAQMEAAQELNARISQLGLTKALRRE
jgi:hypothetical protein